MDDTGTYLIAFMVVWAVIGALVTPILFARRGRAPLTGFFMGAGVRNSE